MRTQEIICNLGLFMYTISFCGADIPHSVPVFDETCEGDVCERSHTLAEQLADAYITEQQNVEIPEKSDTDIIDNTEMYIENDKFVSSRCTSCDGTSEFDSVSDRSEILEEVPESKANEKVESTLENIDLEERENLISNEVDENIDEETGLPELQVIGFNKVNPDKDIQEDISRKENSEQQTEPAPPRRRYFPLLYTIRTLLNSLLSEFGDEGGSQEVPYNSSDTSSANVTTSEDQIKDLNATINGTDSSRKTRFQCAVKNITDNATGEVKIVNSTELLEILNVSKNQKMSPCVLVMFYAPWCHFCARAAPHYNALARVFPQLDVLAVDTSHFSYLNARFGTVAVPNLMLFHARSAVRFNHTARALENFVTFVTNNTGLEPDKIVKLEPEDFVGPLPCVVVQGRDWLLWLAWTFVIVCSACGFVRSQYGQSLIIWLRVLWQEHQHIE